MSLILDTSILIAIERQDKNVIHRVIELSKVHPGSPSISFFSLFEFLWGVRERNIKNKGKASSFLNNFTILHTTKKTADILVGLRSSLEKSGKIFPIADLFIASQVIEAQGVLVTTDRDFLNIPDVSCEVVT